MATIKSALRSWMGWDHCSLELTVCLTCPIHPGIAWGIRRLDLMICAVDTPYVASDSKNSFVGSRRGTEHFSHDSSPMPHAGQADTCIKVVSYASDNRVGT
jgi:hypothetical protein